MEEEFKIEKGIPIKGFNQTGMTSVLKKLEVGDSIFFNEHSTHTRNRTYGIAKRLGIKIIVRKVDGGSRLWRVE